MGNAQSIKRTEQFNGDTAMKMYKITIKGQKSILWATESQAEYIVQRKGNQETANILVRLGNMLFEPANVVAMACVDAELYDLPIYAVERLKNENNGQIEQKLLTPTNNNLKRPMRSHYATDEEFEKAFYDWNTVH